MLTGKTRYRIGWRKRLVMQVEEWLIPWSRYPHSKVSPYGSWRDATIEDMQQIARGEVVPDKPPPQSRWPAPPPPREHGDGSA